MSREEDEKDGVSRLSLDDSKKMKPPNKKKFDEDMDGLTNQIKDKETELERARQAAAEIKQYKTERMDCISKRKQIVIDLEKINKEIPDRMKRLNEIEASLYYKNEDKINSAIQRLEWNLNVKTYKLTEEKKIVSEIDSLKRSKKNLVQYLTLKQEISEIRDKQKGLRDGRDRYTKDFNRLKAKEEELRSQNRSLLAIKREIDALYEQRRQTNANFKQQRGEFIELKEKSRKESWKKKAEERKFYGEDVKQEWVENETERLPHESDVHTCVTLTSYLNHLMPAMGSDASHDSLSPASSQDDPELAEEIEDGQYKLLRKSDDADTLDTSQGGGGVALRRLSRRSRKFRRLAMDKKFSHPPEVMSQFMSLNLTAPSCLYEVPVVIEQLEKKRIFFEKEQQQLCEATSDAGISATESALCVMSRQASKTESCEGGVQDTTGSGSCRPDDSVYAALLQQQEYSNKGGHSASKQEELCGAVGGKSEEDHWSSVVAGVGSDTPNSDSTIEGDNGMGLGDSPKMVVRQEATDSVDKRRSWKDVTASHPRDVNRGERREMKRSLAISVSDSTDSSSLVDQQPNLSTTPTTGLLIADGEFPSLLETSQTSLLSEASFPSLGTSGGSNISPWHDSGSSGNSNNNVINTASPPTTSYKQAAVLLSSPSSSSSGVIKAHSPLTKTCSIIPQDFSTPNQYNQQQQQHQSSILPPKSKSYASSVVGRARSFSEVMPKKSGGSGGSSLNKSSGSCDSPRMPTSYSPSSSFSSSSPKQIQPPSSLSISPNPPPINPKQQPITTPTLLASSAKPKPSLHRSRTLTPTLTRTWAEVRDRHRKSSGNSSGSGGGGGGGGNVTPSGSFNSGSSMINTSSRPTSSTGNPANVKSPLSIKAQVSPSLSSSSAAIPSPHKSALSPRMSYPLQSKPSSIPTPPMIVIDSDRDFPPLTQSNNSTNGQNNNPSSRRNSSLSTKSSSGSLSLSLHDRDAPALNPGAITVNTTSDNNNNHNSSSNSYLDMTPGGLPSPSTPLHSTTFNSNPQSPNTQSTHLYNAVVASTPAQTNLLSTTTPPTTTNVTTHSHSHSRDTNLSSLPKGDKLSTEKWVESSMAFVQDLTSCSLSEGKRDSGQNPTSL